jgi:hypothetical protein
MRDGGGARESSAGVGVWVEWRRTRVTARCVPARLRCAAAAAAASAGEQLRAGGQVSLTAAAKGSPGIVGALRASVPTGRVELDRLRNGEEDAMSIYEPGWFSSASNTSAASLQQAYSELSLAELSSTTESRGPSSPASAVLLEREYNEPSLAEPVNAAESRRSPLAAYARSGELAYATERSIPPYGPSESARDQPDENATSEPKEPSDAERTGVGSRPRPAPKEPKEDDESASNE